MIALRLPRNIRRVHADVLYTPFEAMKRPKETTVTKFDFVEVVFRLGVDPRKSGPGESVARFPATAPARPPGSWSSPFPRARGSDRRRVPTRSAATAHREKVAKGYTDFDVAVAAYSGQGWPPGRVLGPGLMPNLRRAP